MLKTVAPWGTSGREVEQSMECFNVQEGEKQ
jgi:hypothetical protein